MEYVMENIIVRKECKNDHGAVYALIDDAFFKRQNNGRDEHIMISKLRGSNSFIHELSLVAELEGEIVGTIMFSEVLVGGVGEASIELLTVNNCMKDEGIELKLLEKAQSCARRLGYHYIIVLGCQKFYNTQGYKPIHEFCIEPPDEPPYKIRNEKYMAINLHDKHYEYHGKLRYADEFYT